MNPSLINTSAISPSSGNGNVIFRAVFVFRLIRVYLYTLLFINGSLMGQTQGLTDRIDSLALAKMDQYNIPGLAIGVIEDGKMFYSKGYGINNIEEKIPVTGMTAFHTASISKLFTAMGIYQLADRGLLSLDDRLLKYLPTLNYQDERVEQITLRYMLNHTSGMGDVNNYHWENYKTSESSLRDYVLGNKLRKLISTPGVEYHYSNLAYDYLGYVIEMVSGVSFEEYLKNNILSVAGMEISEFRHFLIPDSLRTAPHTLKGQSVVLRKYYPYNREHAPSSTLNSSAMELSSWMVWFLSNAEKYHEMLAPSTDAYPGIGLGFQLGKIDELNWAGHFGGDRGFRSLLLMIPENGMGVVLLANSDRGEDFRQEIGVEIIRWMSN